ncbi:MULTISPECIES: thiol-disulfide oxidoreductase DCC family protein [unclassified Pseudomonas]|uniref:thiol-disulfide oxidoreductase DCC family protein n=1 Tax=unclassified Pseudomonas TaxID=196821 RepID=UPI002449FFF1|nr:MULTISPECIES: thiol-disulfide oxidoreductase DCC family protein [unclassified Pseudomonas]MDG9924121.1 thiol-disulfide oxidoreductase DCC family protein [Pseudomonas sp. GD04045]MDH0036551.1 thiol-disulfide oxidoreductase DCC family protein [Pseudomonas sp. GD04019]
MALPPHIQAGERVVLFDGVCRLCNGWAKFLIRHDHARRFRLCSVQSAEGQAILAWFGLPTDAFETMAYVEGETLFVRSDAVLRIVAQLPGAWRLLAILRCLPRVLRDWCYDRIALNRYRLFGRYDTCLLPDADHQRRFLDADEPRP